MITGDKVTLCKINKTNLNEYIRLNSEFKEIHGYYPVKKYSKESIMDKFNKTGYWGKGGGTMLIYAGNIIVGEISFYISSPNIFGYEIGYRIFSQNHRNKGYMSEALILFSAYLFQWSKSILTLILLITEENTPSIKVAEKCFYKRCGKIPKAGFKNGKFFTYYIYSLLREDCPPIKDLTGYSAT